MIGTHLLAKLSRHAFFFFLPEMRSNVPLPILDHSVFLFANPRRAISLLFQGEWPKASCTLGTCAFSAPLSSHVGQCERLSGSFSSPTRAHLRVSTDALELKLRVQGIEAGIAL